jgi:hypothetical protein
MSPRHNDIATVDAEPIAGHPRWQIDDNALQARVRRSVGDEWGRSESIDPDNVGDIADEGLGHWG